MAVLCGFFLFFFFESKQSVNITLASIQLKKSHAAQLNPRFSSSRLRQAPHCCWALARGSWCQPWCRGRCKSTTRVLLGSTESNFWKALRSSEAAARVSETCLCLSKELQSALLFLLCSSPLSQHISPGLRSTPLWLSLVHPTQLPGSKDTLVCMPETWTQLKTFWPTFLCKDVHCNSN